MGRMLGRWASVAVVATALAAGPVVTAAQAGAATVTRTTQSAAASPQVTATRYVCLENTSNLCLDSPQSSPLFQVDNGAEYNIVQVGTVSGPNSYPFAPGSGLNSHYNGEPVEELAPVNAGSNCVSAGPIVTGTTYGDVVVGACSSSHSLWVGDNNQHLVSVTATSSENYGSSFHPYVMDAYPNKGSKVYFHRDDTVPSQNIDKWAYGE